MVTSFPVCVNRIRKKDMRSVLLLLLLAVVAAAAKRWNVEPATCRAENGEVHHAASGRKLGYGELAADAAQMPVPENVTLKSPAEFKLIGTAAKRLDTPSKVNGTAVYGIDARPPGVNSPSRSLRTGL